MRCSSAPQALAVELGDLAGVPGGDRLGPLLHGGEHRVHRGAGIAGASVEERVEIPGDGQQVRIVGDVGRAHGPTD
jgi:hypothetical protein